MGASNCIVSGSFFGGNIEEGTFHLEFVGGFCCGDTPYTESELRAPAEPIVIDPPPATEVVDEDPSFQEQEVLAA